MNFILSKRIDHRALRQSWEKKNREASLQVGITIESNQVRFSFTGDSHPEKHELVTAFQPVLAEVDSSCRILGLYRGKFFHEWAPEVTRLKRQGEYDQAVQLLIELIRVIEEVDDAEPQPMVPPYFYYEQLAIIYRKKKDYDSEIELLERFVRRENEAISFRRESDIRFRQFLEESEEPDMVELRETLKRTKANRKTLSYKLERAKRLRHKSSGIGDIDKQ
jgi:hypothetical protein